MAYSMIIEDKRIGADFPSFIIAEIGINHNGSLKLALEMIESAAKAGADCVKFQMRHLDSLYVNAGNADDFKENLGAQYVLDLLAKYSLSDEDMFKCFDYCKKLKVIPLCTPWDEKSIEVLEEYGMGAYKVASADLTNHDLLLKLALTKKPIICSTGMSSEEEIKRTAEMLQNENVQFALLHCNSTYPPHMKDIKLNYINNLKKLGNCVVGYSGHERGFHIPVAAVAIGANIIEKHFTFDKNMEGNDHKVSLLPDEFKTMVGYIRDVETTMMQNGKREPTQGELMNRVTLAKSLVAKKDIKIGELITEKLIDVKGPGRGLQPIYKSQILGTKAKREFKAGDFFYQSDLDDQSKGHKNYKLKRKWGIPVRYYDFKTLMCKSNPQLLEFHLSFKDMELDYQKFFNSPLDMDFTVHTPDTYSGDHLLNLASTDKKYRERTINELQKVVDLTNSLKKYFTKATKPLIITSVGGFTQNEFISENQRNDLYELVADSLSKVDQDGVEIIPQTLPPLPWYFGGQLYCNLFVTPIDTLEFCKKYKYRVCFDVSHSMLAANYYKFPLSDFVTLLKENIAHLHLVDAKGLDSEGLPIGEGEIDFASLSVLLDKYAPHASFIPEIWMGHENEGYKMWEAMNKLENWY